jgi:hypothetical protein
MHHARTPPERPSERLKGPVSKDLEEVLLRGLAKKPHDRFASARAFSSALSACENAGDWTAQKAEAWWQDLTAGKIPEIEKSATAKISEAATVLLAEGANRP